MQSKFEVTVVGGDPYLVRLRQRAEALHYIETTGKCPGIIPWPLTYQIEGRGPDPKLCSQCDLYVDCPILDLLQTKAPRNSEKTASNLNAGVIKQDLGR